MVFNPVKIFPFSIFFSSSFLYDALSNNSALSVIPILYIGIELIPPSSISRIQNAVIAALG